MSVALNDLLKSIEGLIVMSVELDELFKCLHEGRLLHVSQRTYKSLKTLPAWFQDLCQPMNFFHPWINSQRQPSIYFISTFSYLTAVLQRTARKNQIAVDQLSWKFNVDKTEDKYLSNIDDGVYVSGLYLEGAGWD